MATLKEVSRKIVPMRERIQKILKETRRHEDRRLHIAQVRRYAQRQKHGLGISALVPTRDPLRASRFRVQAKLPSPGTEQPIPKASSTSADGRRSRLETPWP
jgi:hypothetical protein